jgi:hypothetical protein
MATTDRIRIYLDGEPSLELPASDPLDSSNSGSPACSNGTVSLIACSRCLRVLRDHVWVHPETVIRERRSFEYEAPPRFEPVVCPLCTLSIQLRRAQARGAHDRDTARARGRR